MAEETTTSVKNDKPVSHALPAEKVVGAEAEVIKPTKPPKLPRHDLIVHGTHVEHGKVKGTFIGYVRDEKSGEYDKSRSLVLPYGATSHAQAVEVPTADIKAKIASVAPVVPPLPEQPATPQIEQEHSRGDRV